MAALAEHRQQLLTPTLPPGLGTWYAESKLLRHRVLRPKLQVGQFHRHAIGLRQATHHRRQAPGKSRGWRLRVAGWDWGRFVRIQQRGYPLLPRTVVINHGVPRHAHPPRQDPAGLLRELLAIPVELQQHVLCDVLGRVRVSKTAADKSMEQGAEVAELVLAGQGNPSLR
jgi:hypothetical protein